jgi:hypothetical protein
MSLYLTLPSNSSAKYFPNNRASHYFTKLPQPIYLSGDWEVGLVEIQFTNTYSNVPDDQVYMDYTRSGPPKDVTRLIDTEVPSGGGVFTDCNKRIVLKGGFYESREVFITNLTKDIDHALGVLPNKKHRVSLSYNFATKKVTLSVWEDNAYVKLSQALQNILGFATNTFRGPSKATALETMDINQDFNSMFVYCDLVSPRPVGDVMVPLLRTLPIADHKRELTHAIFDRPHYIPLSRFQFEDVEMLITSDTGQELSFPHGHTIVTLHFRRARSEAFSFF